jgi:hypothetical protein
VNNDLIDRRLGAELALTEPNSSQHTSDAVMTSWHPDSDATPTPQDVTFMVETLESHHGLRASGIAEFYSLMHALRGDAGRSWAWAGVAEAVKRRQIARARLH